MKFLSFAAITALACLLPSYGAETKLSDPGTTSGAAFPKGSYSALNKLPDWGGVWVLKFRRPAPGEPPAEQPVFKGEYLARYLAWQKEVRENNGLARKDASNCMPPGMPNMMATGQYPIEFLFTPGRVTMHHEAWMQWRSIYTDGRGHPDDWELGIFGHSIGHWEGQTLVVETIGIKTITELGAGMKHSDKLRLTERISLSPTDPNTLTDELTMEDTEALEKPYRRVFNYTRQRDWSLMEFVCAENDRNPVDKDGHTTFNRDLMNKRLLWMMAMALCAAGPAAQAHHSLSGVFDITKSFEIDGLVSRVDWMNPHVYVYVDGKGANGKPMTYRLESLPVAMMRKAGLSKTSLLGDGKPVKVHAYPARAGTPDLGYMLTIKFADGREIQFSKIPGAESVTPK